MRNEQEERDKHAEQKMTSTTDASSLVITDSPDDFAYEGKRNTHRNTLKRKNLGDNAFVTIDSPDDLE